jgi:hypothetical protein
LSVSIAGGSGSGPDVADIPSAVAAGAPFVTSGAGASVVAGTASGAGVASGAFSATVSVGAASATGAGVDSVYIKVSRCSNRCFHDVAIDLG